MRPCSPTDVLAEAVGMVTVDPSTGECARRGARLACNKEGEAGRVCPPLCVCVFARTAGPVADHVRSVLRMVSPPCGLREVLTGLRLLCKLWELRDKSEVRQALHAAGVHVVLVNRVLDIGLDPPVESLAVLQLAFQCLILMYVRAHVRGCVGRHPLHGVSRVTGVCV